MKTIVQPSWQLVLSFHFIHIAVYCNDCTVFRVCYLPTSVPCVSPQNKLAVECAKQLKAYIKNRTHVFTLPLAPAPTAYQQQVRAKITAIQAGQTASYGQIAKQLKQTSARAVGGACRANPIVLFVPCHRVVAINGLGGFTGSRGSLSLALKKKLLAYEGSM